MCTILKAYFMGLKFIIIVFSVYIPHKVSQSSLPRDLFTLIGQEWRDILWMKIKHDIRSKLQILWWILKFTLGIKISCPRRFFHTYGKLLMSYRIISKIRVWAESGGGIWIYPRSTLYFYTQVPVLHRGNFDTIQFSTASQSLILFRFEIMLEINLVSALEGIYPLRQGVLNWRYPRYIDILWIMCCRRI